MKRIKESFLLLLLLTAFLRPSPIQATEAQEAQLDSIITFGKTLLGKPYRYQSSTIPLLDCSGFVSFIHSKYNVKLPRSSREMARYVKSVDMKEIEKGDLLFFRGHRSKKKIVGHVSMVVEVRGDTVQMMHSSSRGIVIEAYPRKFYTARFMLAGRIPKAAQKPVDLPNIATDSISIQSPIVDLTFKESTDAL